MLTELGDPARLAAGYADRPLHLIGPALFLDYRRLLTTLLATVVPHRRRRGRARQCLRRRPAGPPVVDALGAGVTTALHIAFWTTLAFAVLERMPERGPTTDPDLDPGRAAGAAEPAGPAR